MSFARFVLKRAPHDIVVTLWRSTADPALHGISVHNADVQVSAWYEKGIINYEVSNPTSVSNSRVKHFKDLVRGLYGLVSDRDNFFVDGHFTEFVNVLTQYGIQYCVDEQ